MRSFFALVMPQNLPPLLLLPRPVMPLPILHILLVHGFSIPVHLIICLVIRISSLLLLSLHSYLRLLWLMGLKPWPKESGSACPLPSLPLTYVFCVPDSPFSLISISKLIHDCNCSITFSYSSFTLQDWSTRMTIDIGHESQGFYHLNSTPSSTICASTDEPLLVHHHLGHPNISKFRKMGSRFSSLSSPECESCQRGKHTRVSFRKRLES